MRINSLEIKNFRNLESFSVEFNPNLTVLVANNSAGKTSILDAVSIVFGSYIGSFPTEKNSGFNYQDATIKTKGDEPQYPISVLSNITIKKHQKEIYRELPAKGRKTTTVNAKVLSEYAKVNYSKLVQKESVELPIVAYYGTGRLYKETKITKAKYEKEQAARSYGYHNALNPNSNYKEFREWYIEQSNIEINFIRKSLQSNQGLDLEQSPNYRLLSTIKESINTILKHLNWHNFNFNGEDLVIENAQGVEIAIDNLSDGVKNMLTLVADIAYRCAKLNPNLDNASKQTEGIVLIDEIEMHLHPSWQQSVLHDLRTIFPNIQFIITTHSPQVLSSIKNSNIRIIDPINQEARVPIVNPYGKESVVALEDIMSVSSTPPQEVVNETALLREYLSIIQKGDIDNPDLAKMRQELNSIYGTDYNKLLTADMIINKFRALK